METIGAVLNSPVNAYPPCIQGEVLLRFTDLNFKEEQKKVLHACHVVTLESGRLYTRLPWNIKDNVRGLLVSCHIYNEWFHQDCKDIPDI